MNARLSSILGLLLVSCAEARPCPPESPNAVTTTPAASPAVAPEGPELSSPITFEDMARYPEPGWNVPRRPTFSPDETTLTFLQSESGGDQMALFAFSAGDRAPRVLVRADDLGTQGLAPSLAQELRDERQRKKIKGITDYQWAGGRLMIPFEGKLYLREATGAIKPLGGAEDAIDPKLCERGERLFFVREGEVLTMDLATQKLAVLAPKDPKGKTFGLSDFNGQEEFDEPSGLFPSPDCKRVLYLEVDESKVAEIPVLMHRAGKPVWMMQKYPEAGRQNPEVKLWIRGVEKGDRALPIARPEGVGADAYVGRFQFSKAGDRVVWNAISRDQKTSWLITTELGKDGRGAPKSRVIATETKKTGWVEMKDVLLSPDGLFAHWIVQHGGFFHVDQIDVRDGSRAVLTEGEWNVFELLGVRPDGQLLVTTNRHDPIGRQLESVKKGSITRLTQTDGTHELTVSSKGSAYLDIQSSLTSPPVATLSMPGATFTIPAAKDPALGTLALRSAEDIAVPLPGGQTMYGAVLPPKDFDPTKHYPLVVMVYGGPGVQTVQHRWSPRLLWNHLSDRGFFVAQFDNRGSSGRGPAFEQATANNLGAVEIADQKAGLEALLKRYPIDASRVALYGHSYGGFLSAYAMLKSPGTYALGIAGSPVTDWRLYDTGYTERYMGTPQSNAAGYDASDLEKFAGALQGKLVLLHALGDENVHFQNTADLVDALIREKKPFEQFIFPSERHGYRAAKAYAFEWVIRKLVLTLGPPR